MEDNEPNRTELLNRLREAPDLPRGTNGNGTQRCYQVQARACRGCGPKPIVGCEAGWNSKSLTDTQWQTLHFPAGVVGVPASRWNEEYARHGYLSYSAAQALRWWFLAEQNGISGIETRLVEYEFKYSYSATALKVACVVDPEKREDIMPDWATATET